MSAPRVLVTGPVESLREYAEAARAAGWDPIEHPLLGLDPRPFEGARVSGRYDWICLTSSGAIPFLEAALAARPDLREASFAAVGERTSERGAALGLRPALAPAADAAELAAAVLAAAEAAARVLWPRGSQSGDLARALRDGGLVVDDPVAYETRPLDRATAAPEAEAVFFASPSAVRVWHERPAAASPARQVAIAIGATTFEALLGETEARFFDTISLPRPTPEAFGIVLGHLDVEADP